MLVLATPSARTVHATHANAPHVAALIVLATSAGVAPILDFYLNWS